MKRNMLRQQKFNLTKDLRELEFNAQLYKSSIPLGITRSVEKDLPSLSCIPFRDASLTGCRFRNLKPCSTERYNPDGLRGSDIM